MARLSVLLLFIATGACIVNNNNSPGANGTVAPQTNIDPQVGVAMPGGSTQVNRAPARPTATASASPSASPSGPKVIPAPPPP
jgi:hypothetical protein